MNKKCVTAVALCFAISGAASVLAQERREVPEFRTCGKPASAEDARAVDALIRNFKDAWGRQDTAALVALHADDVEWINAYARLIQGAEPLGRFLRGRLFPAFDPAISRQEAADMKATSIRFLGGNAAVFISIPTESADHRETRMKKPGEHTCISYWSGKNQAGELCMPQSWMPDDSMDAR